MKESEEQFMELSSAGGEKTVDGSTKSQEQLLQMMNSVAINGGRIVLFNMKKFDRNFLKKLADTGKGNVLFDLR